MPCLGDQNTLYNELLKFLHKEGPFSWKCALLCEPMLGPYLGGKILRDMSPKCKLLHWGFCFKIVTLQHVSESGVGLILWKNKFEWIGFFGNEETHVYPSELANDGINGNMWSLEKGERITLIKFPYFPHWRKWKPLCSSSWGKWTETPTKMVTCS